jgi:hypothetical protein
LPIKSGTSEGSKAKARLLLGASVGSAGGCPVKGVQQFQNDHFQTGDFTGYTQTLFTIDNGTCTGAFGGSIAPYIGSYDATNVWSLGTASLTQSFPASIPVSCIVSSSVFSVTVANIDYPCDNPTVIARILYDDGTHTDVQLSFSSTAWTTTDLRPYLQSGKKISGLTILVTYPGSSCEVHVGQFNLKV